MTSMRRQTIALMERSRSHIARHSGTFTANTLQTPMRSHASQGPVPSGNLRGGGQSSRVDGHTGRRGRTVREEGEGDEEGGPGTGGIRTCGGGVIGKVVNDLFSSGAWPDELERRDDHSFHEEPKKCHVANPPLEWPTHLQPTKPVHKEEQWDDLPIPGCCNPMPATQRDT